MIGKSLFVGNQIEWTALDPEKDAASLSAWTMDLQFSKHLFAKPTRPATLFEVKKKVKEDLKEADEKRNAYFFAIRKKGEAELVAVIRFEVNQQAGGLFIDFASLEALALYGAELMPMALRYGFMELSLHRLSISIPGYCEEEMKLIESNGFIRESQRRDADFCNGKFYDLMGYSMLRQEYKKQQQEVEA